MKQKSKKLIILFIISLVMILCFATIVKAATLSLSKTALELEVGKTETLTCTGAEENATINWTSSDTSIATIDSTGKVTAVKEGTATITATVGEDTATCAVTIKAISTSTDEDNIQWTDFENAQYELVNSTRIANTLYIKNIKPIDERTYFYCITDKNEKPDLKTTSNGYKDSTDTKWNSLVSNNNDGFSIYNMEQYVELNQDMYLWIVEFARTEATIPYKSEYVVSGKKIERPKYPVYAEMFFATMMTHDTTQIVFNIPTGKETKRKFTLKIGKITDKNILNGIKNNNGESWNSLLTYANNSDAVFNEKLTSSSQGGSEYVSYGGSKLINLKLEDKAYYYMYVVFDDENGKYYPASGLTIAKASVYTDGAWYMFFLGDKDFKWDDFGTDQTGTATVDGKTTGTTAKKPSKLPKTGTIGIGFIVVIIAGFAVFFKVKNNKYKGI